MSNRRIWRMLAASVALMCTTASGAQEVALKTNLLYDATTTPNLGVEVALGPQLTGQVFYGLNPWKFDTTEHGERKANHWLVMPEVRWWPCTTMNGWFFGVHGMTGQFNAGKVNLPLPGTFFGGDNIGKEARDYRYEGTYLGGGVTAGYQWILSRHWNLEAEVGVGYDHVWNRKFPCADCGTLIDKSSSNYVGLTKAGLSLMYVF